MILAVHAEDKGKYTCEVSNGSGTRQVTVELTVEGESQKAEPCRELSFQFPRACSSHLGPLLGDGGTN